MWVILGLLVVGGIVVYRRQRPDRKEAIKKVAGEMGQFLLEEASRA